jgi:Ca2+-binding RTX toxin-like protein
MSKSISLVEGLESRKLFAATAVLAGTTLTITGTNSNDTIELSKSGSSLKVKLNGTTKTFTSSKVSSIVANLLNGNDKFKSTTSVKQRMTVNGGDGNDSIVTGGGNDSIRGNNGNDVMDGATGNDDMRGNSGTDTADYSNRTYDLAIALNDVADDGIGTGGHDNVHSDIENVKGGKGYDYISGSSANNEFWAGPGGGEMYGMGGNDKLHGGDGDDYIRGGSGNDTIWGGAGVDDMSGEAGHDTLFAQDGETDIVNDVIGTGDLFAVDAIDSIN